MTFVGLTTADRVALHLCSTQRRVSVALTRRQQPSSWASADGKNSLFFPVDSACDETV